MNFNRRGISIGYIGYCRLGVFEFYFLGGNSTVRNLVERIMISDAVKIMEEAKQKYGAIPYANFEPVQSNADICIYFELTFKNREDREKFAQYLKRR